MTATLPLFEKRASHSVAQGTAPDRAALPADPTAPGSGRSSRRRAAPQPETAADKRRAELLRLTDDALVAVLRETKRGLAIAHPSWAELAEVVVLMHEHAAGAREAVADAVVRAERAMEELDAAG